MLGTLEGNSYSVGISMSSQKRNEMNGKYKLYVFRAVKGQGTGKPVVWQRIDNIYNSMGVHFEGQCGAYIAAPDITFISGRTDVEIDLGQIMAVDAYGNPTILTGGPSDAILISNQSSKKFTCGISEYVSSTGTFNPLCAFDLLEHYENVLAPIQRVLLIFATNVIETAMVVRQAMSDGIVIDLTKNNNRSVEYTDDGFWVPDSMDGTTRVKSQDPLSPFLINPAQDYETK